jgi:hypothetical protein
MPSKIDGSSSSVHDGGGIGPKLAPPPDCPTLADVHSPPVKPSPSLWPDFPECSPNKVCCGDVRLAGERDSLRAENNGLRKLVVQLSAIVLRNIGEK